MDPVYVPPSSDELLRLLQQVKDPELGQSVVDLGLIYEASSSPEGTCTVVYTLTSPACPFGKALEQDMRATLSQHPRVRSVELHLTFDPPWSTDRISPTLRRELRLTGFPV